MTTERQKSNIMVTVPDFSAPLAQALAEINERHVNTGEEPATQLNFTPHGYVLTKEGMYVLNTEGVGNRSPITPENKAEIGLYPEWDEGEGRKRMSALPAGFMEFSDTELIMLPTLKEVPLEEFIRSFGHRLENNYNLWLGSLRESEVMTMESST